MKKCLSFAILLSVSAAFASPFYPKTARMVHQYRHAIKHASQIKQVADASEQAACALFTKHIKKTPTAIDKILGARLRKIARDISGQRIIEAYHVRMLACSAQNFHIENTVAKVLEKFDSDETSDLFGQAYKLCEKAYHDKAAYEDLQIKKAAHATTLTLVPLAYDLVQMSWQTLGLDYDRWIQHVESKTPSFKACEMIAFDIENIHSHLKESQYHRDFSRIRPDIQKFHMESLQFFDRHSMHQSSFPTR